jgi:hypothetical protein
MLELTPLRKNKINLADYNSAQDIENRILLSDFSPFDLEVLEEILFSPLKISLKKLARNLDVPEEQLSPILGKLAKGGLLSLADDSILVDKDRRKYFEFQVQRFDPPFKPDLEFLQGLLRKVPIHVLPMWYSIPRSSNNIFTSILEKHLLTPQIFQRYLSDLNFQDPIIQGIVKDLFSAPDFRISSSDLISKYNLMRTDFEEIMLLLEFSFICSIRYIKEDDHWLEIVTPLHEWHQYLQFLESTEAPVIDPPDSVQRTRESDFAFVEDMAAILGHLQKRPEPLHDSPSSELIATCAAKCKIPLETFQDLFFAKTYLTHLFEKLCMTKLASKTDGRLYALDTANDWLDSSLENKALYLYRHPFNRILNSSSFADLEFERHIREAEKSIKRVLHGKWVFFDDFIKGVIVPFSEDSVIMLKRVGKHWKYTLPTYQEPEIALIKATVFEWLFEAGIVATGTCDGRDCFCVTSFGRFFFED